MQEVTKKDEISALLKSDGLLWLSPGIDLPSFKILMLGTIELFYWAFISVCIINEESREDRCTAMLQYENWQLSKGRTKIGHSSEDHEIYDIHSRSAWMRAVITLGLKIPNKFSLFSFVHWPISIWSRWRNRSWVDKQEHSVCPDFLFQQRRTACQIKSVVERTFFISQSLVKNLWLTHHVSGSVRFVNNFLLRAFSDLEGSTSHFFVNCNSLYIQQVMCCCCWWWAMPYT